MDYLFYRNRLVRKIKSLYKKVLFIYKKILPKTLFYRTLLIISSTLLIAQIVFAILFYDHHWRKIKNMLLNNLLNNISNLVNQANAAENPEQLYNIVANFRKYSDLNPQLVFIENDLVLINPTNKNKTSANLLVSLQQYLPNNPIFINEYGPNYSILKILIQVKEKTYISFYLEKNLFFTKTLSILLVTNIFAYLACIAVTLQFIRLQIRPLKKLAKSAKLFGQGENVAYIVPSGSVEIIETTIAFNEMKSQIQEFIDQRTMLLSSVSHDLKTSLTKMNLILDVNKHTIFTEELKEEIDSMYQMISSYLHFASEDSVQGNKEIVNIKNFLMEIVSNTAYKKLVISLDIEQLQSKMSVNVIAIKRALDNILSNALSFAKKVNITVKNYNVHTIVISIEDDGIGIPKDKHELVFKPFYRINEARTSEYGSVGLGLYIVKDIITKHGGCVEIGDSIYGGLKIDIILPV